MKNVLAFVIWAVVFLTNPGFETGDLTGWSGSNLPFNNSNTAGDVSVSNVIVHAGNFSLRVGGALGSDPVVRSVAYSDYITVLGSTNYTLGFWRKIDVLPVSTYVVRLYEYDLAGVSTAITTMATYATTDAAMTQTVGSPVTTQTNTAYVRIVVIGPLTATAVGYFDDFELTSRFVTFIPLVLR